MKRAITTCICTLLLGGAAVGQNYQIPNSDFEIWNDTNEPGNGWNSFVSAKASNFLISLGIGLAKVNTTQIEGRTGSGVQIKSADIMGKNANGNLTTGRINMGSMTPTDASNYNFTDRSQDANNCPFVGLPDSVSCWAKFTRGESGDYSAQGNFILHGDIDYKDPHESEANVSAYRIAGGTIAIAPCTEWTYFSAPMAYTEVTSEKMYMLGSFTTNPTPGASKNDILQIDDVKFIYNSKLASLSIGGEALAGFDKETFVYTIQGELPTEEDIVAVSDGKGAQTSISEDDDVVKIVVTGNDGGSNQHTYLLVKEGAVFAATAIQLDGVDISDEFDPTVTTYENLEMPGGAYPVVSVSSDPTLTDVDMQLNDEEHTITIVVTDKYNQTEHTYTLKFVPSDKKMNGSQIKGDFESQTQWGPESSGRWGTVADGWSSSNVTQLEILNFVMVEEEVGIDGEGSKAVKMVNGRPGMVTLASNAPGYITLGTPWVYADMLGLMASMAGTGTDTDDSDGGTIGGVNFSYQPDSIVGYYKRAYADAESGLDGMNLNEEAKILAYLWKGTSASMAPATDGNVTGSTWQLLIDRDIDVLGVKNDGVPADGVTLVASAEETVKELADWTRISMPLNYVSDEKPEKANVIISSADYFNRGNIGNGNSLSADNVAFVYNSKLASLSIGGEALAGFDKDVYAYEVATKTPEVESIAAVSDGKGATIDVKVEGNVVTITVNGNDIADNAENFHVYTLKFTGGVGIAEHTTDAVSVKGAEAAVVVEGTQPGDRVEVYTVQGVMVGVYASNGGTLTIDGLYPNTIYVVKANAYVTRVLTK